MDDRLTFGRGGEGEKEERWGGEEEVFVYRDGESSRTVGVFLCFNGLDAFFFLFFFFGTYYLPTDRPRLKFCTVDDARCTDDCTRVAGGSVGVGFEGNLCVNVSVRPLFFCRQFFLVFFSPLSKCESPHVFFSIILWSCFSYFVNKGISKRFPSQTSPGLLCFPYQRKMIKRGSV